MMERWSHQDLLQQAAATGFQPETLEKVFQLLAVLEAIAGHPFLQSRLALKGGTALNLFLFDVPRLSVDIDLNYIGTADVEQMLAERPRVEQGLAAVFERLNLVVRRVPTEHAGGKWRVRYASVLGQPANLEVDVNFLLRTPLWQCAVLNSKPIGSVQAQRIPVLDVHELAAGKLCALLARTEGRDLFDSRLLFETQPMSLPLLRMAFVVYGGMNRKDWRRVSPASLLVDPRDVIRSLAPVLPVGIIPNGKAGETWVQNLVEECRLLLSAVLPLEPHELEFLERLNGHGEIVPELLTNNVRLVALVRSHPGLLWKAQNAKQHRNSVR